MTKQYFIPDSVWAQVEAVEAASGKPVSPGTAGTWYAIAGTATAESLTTVAPSYNVSLGAIETGRTVGAPGMGAEVEPALEGADGSPPGSYTWSATVNGVPAALPLKAAEGSEIVLTLSDATHPLGPFSASSAPVIVASTATVPAQMSAPSLVVEGSSKVTATLATDAVARGAPVTGYDLRHSPDETNWTVLTGITSPQAITGLPAATLCYVQTRAVNDMGAGEWSLSAKGTTAPAALKAASNGSGTVDITVEDGTFTVSISGASQAHQNGEWGPFDTAELNRGPVNVVPAKVTGKTGLGDTLTAAPGVWVWDTAHGAATLATIWQRGDADIPGATTRTYTIALADTAASLRYRETAKDAAGAVAQDSNGIQVNAFTAPLQMAAPTLTVVSASEISATCAAAPADGGSAITSYDLRWSTDQANWTEVTGITSPRSITGLTAATLCYVQTRAVNALGAGAWSASASATTNAASKGITDPRDVGAVIWLDLTDFAYQKQDTAGKIAVTAISQNVRYLVDRSGNGNNFTARYGSPASVSASGALSWNGAIFIPAAKLTGLTSEMEVYALVNTSDATWCLIGKNQFASHAVLAQDGNSSSAVVGFAGTTVLSTNGVDIVGTPNRQVTHTKWSIGTNVIAGVRGLDLSAGTDSTMASNFMPLAYTTSFGEVIAKVTHVILTPALTTQKRSDLINWLKAEGGIA